MTSTTETEGRFDLVVAAGRMSLSEIAALTTGSVVRFADRIAGDPVDLCFNGALLTRGQIERVVDLLMVRVAFNDWQPHPGPQPPVRDDIVETLGTQLRIAAVHGKLGDVRGIGEYGLINLGLELGFEQEAELLAAGVPVARGVAGFIGEAPAISVTRVLAEAPDAGTHYSTGALVRRHAETFRSYHFGRPDLFSRQQLLRLQNVHELVVHNLASLPQEMTVQRIDQLRADEVLARAGDRPLWTVRSERSHSGGREPVDAPQRRGFAQLSGAARRVDEENATTLATHAVNMDDAYALDETLVVLSDPSTFQTPRSAGIGLEREILTALRNAWRTLARIPALEIEPITARDLASHPVNAGRMMLLVELGTTPDAPQIMLAYPAMLLLKLARGLR